MQNMCWLEVWKCRYRIRKVQRWQIFAGNAAYGGKEVQAWFQAIRSIIVKFFFIGENIAKDEA
jgi:hypothetical protein